MITRLGKQAPLVLLLVMILSLIGCEQPIVEETITEPVAMTKYPLSFEQVIVETSQETLHLDPLTHAIHTYFEEVGVDESLIAYTISDLVTGREWNHNEALAFRAGSVYKLPLAMLYYDGINQGYIDPTKELEYEDWITEEGGYIFEVHEQGDKIPIWDVLHYVIAYSDNVAGHMLYANYGGWYYMREQALQYSPYKEEELYYDLGGYFTARYLDGVMEYLYLHQANYPRLMHDLAGAAPDTYLNSDSYGLAYQKVGNAEYFFNAAGFVLGDHPYSITVLTGFGEFGHIVMGRMNTITYNYFYPPEE